jgi:hypothetical protein
VKPETAKSKRGVNLVGIDFKVVLHSKAWLTPKKKINIYIPETL